MFLTDQRHQRNDTSGSSFEEDIVDIYHYFQATYLVDLVIFVLYQFWTRRAH